MFRRWRNASFARSANIILRHRRKTSLVPTGHKHHFAPAPQVQIAHVGCAQPLPPIPPSAVIPKQNTLAQIPQMPRSRKRQRQVLREIRPNEAGWEPSRLQGTPSVTASPRHLPRRGRLWSPTPEGSRSRSHIFTNHRKVLLFLIREARPVRVQCRQNLVV